MIKRFGDNDDKNDGLLNTAKISLKSIDPSKLGIKSGLLRRLTPADIAPKNGQKIY